MALRSADGGRPVAGLVLELRDASGRAVAAAVTGADRTYQFERVSAGQYPLTCAAGRPVVTTIPADAVTAELVLEGP
ncbi:hypothetical protein [Amycolatopsis sp. ATCC 39116]|uniref:hypothetical protein n=1 Tax=Amycolatopsis sp. (strain ATCC 39116 / 75iv2) TaxID=385957 RepID=UPI0002625DD2|nr:hypothetical protein [Amycolatopsis sp. ATCC 39116]